jgi:hypothetical protein
MMLENVRKEDDIFYKHTNLGMELKFKRYDILIELQGVNMTNYTQLFDRLFVANCPHG